jgi:hypothetical protein
MKNIFSFIHSSISFPPSFLRSFQVLAWVACLCVREREWVCSPELFFLASGWKPENLRVVGCALQLKFFCSSGICVCVWVCVWRRCAGEMYLGKWAGRETGCLLLEDRCNRQWRSWSWMPCSVSASALSTTLCAIFLTGNAGYVCIFSLGLSVSVSLSRSLSLSLSSSAAHITPLSTVGRLEILCWFGLDYCW